ncbi:kelch-like protein 12 [Branchiostoma lanceolatum]|uniref:kelch-like protein 12 n=1 Tax=Branchiostoma lanceolatum TaxID=7740 RepID=UPI00345735BE
MAAAQQENPDKPVRPRSYYDRVYSDGFLGIIGDLQKARVLQDVVLEVGGRQFPCHRLVLSAASPYFRAMFTSGMAECHQKTVVLQGLDAAAFEKILRYIYSGTVIVSQDKVQSLYQAADLLQLDHVRGACSKYMALIVGRSTCVDLYKFAHVFSIESVLKECLPCIYRHFAKVASSEEFFSLSVNQLTEIISHDELDVTEETTVWEAVVRWVQHSREDRLHHLPSILPHIRFNLLTSDDKAAILEHPLVRENPESFEVRNLVKREASNPKRRGMDAEEMVLLFRSARRDDQDTREMLCVNPRSGEYMKFTDEGLAIVPAVLTATVTSDNDIYSLVKKHDDEVSLLRFNQPEHIWEEKLSFHRNTPKHCFDSPAEYLFEVDGHLYYLGVHLTSVSGKRGVSVVMRKHQWLTGRRQDCSKPRYDKLRVPLAVSCGGQIYLFTDTEMHRYDPSQDRWSRGTPPKTIPEPYTAVTMGTEIFCADATLSNMAVYDVETDSWRELPGWSDTDRNPIPRGGFFALEGHLHALVDFHNPRDNDDFVDDEDDSEVGGDQRIYVYDRLAGTWRDSQVTLPHGRWRKRGSGLPVARILPRQYDFTDCRTLFEPSSVACHGFLVSKQK